MKAKIDLEKFICSYVKWSNIQDALKDQGLKCWNGEIVEIPQESEDERLRKQILNYFMAQKVNEPQPVLDSWIAWLEKQGEQKSKWTEEGIREAQLDYWRSVGGKEWHGVPVQETIAWLEKQKTVEWSEEDENFFANICTIIDADRNFTESAKRKCKDWLKSLKKRMVEQQ